MFHLLKSYHSCPTFYGLNYRLPKSKVVSYVYVLQGPEKARPGPVAQLFPGGGGHGSLVRSGSFSEEIECCRPFVLPCFAGVRELF